MNRSQLKFLLTGKIAGYSSDLRLAERPEVSVDPAIPGYVATQRRFSEQGMLARRTGNYCDRTGNIGFSNCKRPFLAHLAASG